MNYAWINQSRILIHFIGWLIKFFGNHLFLSVLEWFDLEINSS